MKILEILTEKRKIGNIGEKAAARYLKKKGYKILERNFVADNHEIDIIAKKKNLIAYVEVKTRTVGKENPKESRPASSVTPKKQQGIIAAARYYYGFNKYKLGPMLQRLDIIEVYMVNDEKKAKVKEIIHMENAFNLNTAF